MQIINDKKLLNKYIDQYKINDLFSWWNKYDIKLIKYEKGEMLCSKASPLKYLTFVVKGTIEIYFLSAEGNILSLVFKEGFSFIGDMEFVGENQCPTCQAVTDIYCISINIKNNFDILNDDIKFYRFLSKNLAEKLANASKRAYTNSFHSTEERLAEYVLAVQDKGIISENWSEAATVLSCSYRQLMRLLTKFCDNGLIARTDKKGQYIINNIEEIKKIVCEK